MTTEATESATLVKVRRCFILEDDPTRVNLFRKVLAEGGWDIVHAESVEDAKKKFTGVFGLILLDHDLGGRQFQPSDETSGYAFVQWALPKIPTMVDLKSRRGFDVVIVHSFNVDGARRMFDLLAERSVTLALQPFGPTLLNFIKSL